MPILSPYSKYKLRSALLIAGLFTALGILYEHLFDDGVTLMGPLMGFLLGSPLAVMEVYISWKNLHSRPFWVVAVFKALLYVTLISFVIGAGSFMYAYFVGLPRPNISEVVQGRALTGAFTAFISYLVVIFFRHLNRLLGPGVLLRYVRGVYYKPILEERIFMFLDLKDSTALAEEMSYETYYSFLNDFFHDLSTPTLATNAEIFQYVGDEVVFTWKKNVGLRRANCIKLFLEIERVIQNRREYYLNRYGVVPEYKAGLHCGEVIAAEIGDLKRDIVYNGDVLNTTSRIESLCNEHEAKLLASGTLIDQLDLPDFVHAERLGPIHLRGKQAPSIIYRIHWSRS